MRVCAVLSLYNWVIFGCALNYVSVFSLFMLTCNIKMKVILKTNSSVVSTVKVGSNLNFIPQRFEVIKPISQMLPWSLFRNES